MGWRETLFLGNTTRSQGRTRTICSAFVHWMSPGAPDSVGVVSSRKESRDLFLRRLHTPSQPQQKVLCRELLTALSPLEWVPKGQPLEEAHQKGSAMLCVASQRCVWANTILSIQHKKDKEYWRKKEKRKKETSYINLSSKIGPICPGRLLVVSAPETGAWSE